MTTRPIELRSDTFTRPTEAMRRAMYEAEVGDDVWGEDPTVHRLQVRAAELMGKEAGLFVSSGTQGNLIALLSHTARGDEVIVGDQCHIFWYEVAGAAVVGSLQLRTLPNGRDAIFSAADLKAAMRPDDVHAPKTGCLAIENTHNRCGGVVLKPQDVSGMADIAHANGVPVHCDGARIFNAAAAVGRLPADLVGPVDSVTFCLSKALGAPVGSVLCGDAEFIGQALRWRKMLGGGMRQVGVLAAAGLVALEQNVDRLAEDHANARLFAEGLSQVPGITLDLETVQTNIVYFDVSALGIGPEEFCFRLGGRGVRVSGEGGPMVRAVTSYEVSRSDIEQALDAVNQVADEALAIAV